MNSKAIILAGVVVLIIGLFLPVLNVTGIGVSALLPAGHINPAALVLVGCAALAGLLALVGQSKWAVIPGLGAIGYLVWQFLDAQRSVTGGGDLSPEAARVLAELESSLNYLGWGVMGLGAVLIVIGGAMGWRSSAPSA